MKIEFISSSGRFKLISQPILSHNTHTVTHPFTKKILCIVTLTQTHINKQYVHVIRCILIYWSYVYALHTEAQTHTEAQIKGFMGSGWWRANRPEEMEEAHRGEWWEEMMRMMSAEWLASGTDPVRLSAKGVEDRERARWLQRGQEREIEHGRAGEKYDRCQNTITLWQPRFSLSCASWPLRLSAIVPMFLPCTFRRPMDDY